MSPLQKIRPSDELESIFALDPLVIDKKQTGRRRLPSDKLEKVVVEISRVLDSITEKRLDSDSISSKIQSENVKAKSKR